MRLVRVRIRERGIAEKCIRIFIVYMFDRVVKKKRVVGCKQLSLDTKIIVYISISLTKYVS